MTTTTTMQPIASTARPIAGRGRHPAAWLAALALAASALLGGACTHAHLSPNYGVSYNAWFSAQHVRHEPADSEATRRALDSLDAQEAAAISKSFRKNTGDQAEGTGQGQMVMIGQSTGRNDAYTPPPSVPNGN
jgi:hypothetical protein